MTLILSAVTPKFAIQVSDRRITSLRTRELMGSKTNKAVLFGNRIAFGFTGLAQLAGKTTTEWLISVLRDLPEGISLSEVADLVARNAEKAVRTSPMWPSNSHLAFFGAGFLQISEAGGSQGVICTIANFFSESQEPLATPRETFRTDIKTFSGSQSDWYPVGIPLTSAEKRRLHRDFSGCARRKLGPVPIVRLFERVIRNVAARSSAVGSDLMIAIIPRSAAESKLAFARGPIGNIPLTLEAMAVGGSDYPQHQKIVFCYSPADSQEEETYCPGIVVPGGMSFSEIKMTWGKQATESIRRQAIKDRASGGPPDS